MVKSEIKLFKKPEKSKHRQELEQFLVIDNSIVTRYVNALKSLVFPADDISKVAVSATGSNPSLKQNLSISGTSQSTIRDVAIKFLESKSQGDQIIFVKRLESTTTTRSSSTTTTTTTTTSNNNNNNISNELTEQLVTMSISILFEQRSPNLQINKSLIAMLNNLSLSSDNLDLLNSRLSGVFSLNDDKVTIYYAHLITLLSDLKLAAGYMCQTGCNVALGMLSKLLSEQLGVMQQQSGTVYLNEVYADCDYTLRALMSLYSVYPEQLRVLLPQHSNILISLDNILSLSQYPKQIVGLAAFLFTEYLSLQTTTQLQYQQQVIGHFISPPSNNNNNNKDSLLLQNIIFKDNNNNNNNSSSYFNDRFMNYPHLSRVSIFRGLCLSSKLNWLTEWIDTSIVLKQHQHQQQQQQQQTSNRQSIFLNYIYLEIVNACVTAVDVFGRVASIEYLHLWYDILRQQLETTDIESLLHVDYQHFFGNYFNMVLEIIFTNWESTISSIPTQLNEIFNCLLSIHYLCMKQQSNNKNNNNTNDCKQQLSGTASNFIPDITTRLIEEPWTQKGKYALLKSIIDREGALFMFSLKGNFMKDILLAMSDHTICNSAKGFLELLMESLKNEVSKRIKAENTFSDEKLESEAIQEQCELYWLIPLLNVLTECDDNTCSKIILYGTPCFLKVFPRSLISILDVLNKDNNNNNKSSNNNNNNKCKQQIVMDNKISLRISLSVLNTARQLAILEGIEILNNNYSTINQSLYNQDDSLRMLGLELVCCSPKNTERPTRVEIGLLKEFLSLALKSSSPYIRNHTNSILDKFWVRLRESYAKVFRTKSVATAATTTTNELYLSNDEIVEFINWCSSLFVSCLYPGAPYPRKMLPIDAISSMVDAFSAERFKDKPAVVPFLSFVNERSTLFSSSNTLVLINNLWDQYDRCREVASSILNRFPSPLPGFSEQQPIASLILWGLKLACSPKARESDTGAMVLRLYLNKYVALGRSVPTFTANQDAPIALSEFADKDNAVLHYIRQIMRVLRSQVALASSNLLEAAKYAPMHGLILSIRYLLSSPTIDFNRIEKSAQLKEQWRLLISDLIALLFSISNIVLRVVADSAPEGYNPNSSNNSESSSLLPKSLPSGILYDDDERLASSFATLSAAEKTSTSIEELLDQVGGAGGGAGGNNEDEQDDDEESLMPASGDQIKGSAGQIITVCSWQSMKHLSLCLGAILDRVTFPTANTTEQTIKDTLISVEQINEIGRSFVHILLNTRHKGAIEKAYLGFQVLCSRLMGSTLPALYTLPSSWIDSLFKRVQEQSLSITRRSAGLPFVFTGLLTGESTHQKNKMAGPLLQLVITNLLKMASGNNSGLQASEVIDHDLAEQRIYLPQVHSINILRSIFRNKTMTNELGQYFADTMIAIVGAYSSPSWSVRNAATMAFSTMVDKVVGVKKVREESSQLNTTTFHYFFGHMPSLYPFLLEHFSKSLTAIQQEQGQSDHVLQSSVYAILVLFARLQPSNMTDPADSLSPTPFIQYISECCTFSNFMVRQIAARALVPFIPSREVIGFINTLINNVNQSDKRDFNRIHGVLFQIYHLLKLHIPTILSPKDKETMVIDAIGAMERLLWILSKRVVPLAYLVLQIFNELNSSIIHTDLTKYNEHQQQSIEQTLLQVNKMSNAILQSSNTNSEQCERNRKIPLYSSYIHEAGINVLNLLENSIQKRPLVSKILVVSNIEEIVNQLLSMVSHREYEIRLVAIKFLLSNIDAIVKHLHSTGNDNKVISSIQVKLLDILKSENNIPVLKRAARILPKLEIPLQLAGNDLLEFTLNLLPKSGIKKDAIVLFGYAYKQYCLSANSSSSNNSSNDEMSTIMSDKWVEMVSSYSNSEKPHEIRLAITLALGATSSLLCGVDGNVISNRVAIEMWLALATLLEDDEDGIRSMSQTIAWSVLNEQNSCSSLVCDTTKTIQSIYSHLTKRYSNDSYLVNKYQSILAINNTTKSSNNNIYSNEFKSSVVLFDKEEDNYFQEKLLTIQVVTKNLLDIVGQSKAEQPLFNSGQLKTLLERATNYANWIKRSSENNKHSVWTSWLTYNQEVFQPFYQCICSLLVVTSQQSLFTQHQSEINQHITDIQSTLANQPIHPLMLNILHKLEKQCIVNNNNNSDNNNSTNSAVGTTNSTRDYLNTFFLTSL
ncbi:hypothetical protein PPL_01478 [Heterostelium album PN500]|uniref:DUF2428 domain-containing protein n=1 Tax=Heterostelium pallidum (strain ATCC 26659 / Pp 5 / PN500) TaxID=670386 RepID=D3AZD8_HETP5|nr:hypothetical protein PPL_01478 [Heterostelium album PN500]EFA85521.1 hypothetical protein PPL_01478 [Heterostelium album PN500]|eukprot:XP_020437629.1 hypothetical protein PPL_01478 [Heterostelium album PN500]